MKNLLDTWANRPQRVIDFTDSGDLEWVSQCLLALKAAMPEIQTAYARTLTKGSIQLQDDRAIAHQHPATLSPEENGVSTPETAADDSVKLLGQVLAAGDKLQAARQAAFSRNKPAEPTYAEKVKQLREKTGAGLMPCRSALTKAKGDVAAAKAALTGGVK